MAGKGNGSNDLNLFLKAKVVELKVILDVKGSIGEMRKQVDTITELLSKKPVKLKVELNASVTDMNKSISALTTKLNNSKGFKPLKLDVEIDVNGSADNIKKQLGEVTKVVDDFNKKYGKQLKEMQQQQLKAQDVAKKNAQVTNIPTKNNGVENYNNMKKYTETLKEAEKIMKSKMMSGDNGLFSSFEMKDAKGNLLGFIATLEKANGVVEKVKYSWNKDKEKFQIVDRSTATQTEKVVHQSMKALKDLQREIAKTGKAQNSFQSDYDSLMNKGANGTLTMGEVSSLKTAIKDRQVLEQLIDKENKGLLTQKKLVHAIQQSQQQSWKHYKDDRLKEQYQNLSKIAQESKGNYAEIAFELKKVNDESNRLIKSQKDGLNIDKQRLAIQKRLDTVSSNTISDDTTSQYLIKEINLLNKRARTAKDFYEIERKMANLQTSNKNAERLEKENILVAKLTKGYQELAVLGKYSAKELKSSIDNIKGFKDLGIKDLQREFSRVNNEVDETKTKMRELADQSKVLVSGMKGNKMFNDSGFDKIDNLVKNTDIEGIRRYYGEMYKGRVETVKMETTTDKLSRAVNRMKIQMAGTGKTVKTFTVDLDRANSELRQVETGMSYNANRNLGVMEQLRIAMARVPVWMSAMTAFYGTINGVRAMVTEILTLDKALTELRRVASDNISIDYMFEGAVQLSKELGNNIHDVMQSVNDMARTYGNFNERQLLDITRTATLMSNVSDLTAQEATESLIGTMNAFNITASESIKIVDSMNEVDNNYAVSTKQLAEGLTKSASTARTFGKQLCRPA